MATVAIYGVSDDLIEIEGDLNEEFNPSNEDEGMWLIFGDGSIIDVRYDEFGIWRVTRPYAGTSFMEKDEDPGDDENRYSDRVTLTGDLLWVVAAEKVTLHKIGGS